MRARETHELDRTRRARHTRTFADRHLSVLVVDDDDDSRGALSRAVRALGHTCRATHDATEALALHAERPADVIVSDYRMPVIDGAELCRRVRLADGSTRYTYFVFVTALDDREHLFLGMEAGADDYQHKPIDIDELRARLVSAARVVTLHRRLERASASLRHESERSFELARVDALTGMGNRLRMKEDLVALWARARRYEERYVVAICDVDRFKDYNDREGHVAGDDVLRRVSLAVRGAVGGGDADALYRYGGEEFLAVLPRQSLDDAAAAMERVRLAVARLAIPAPNGVVTISVGVAELSDRDASIEAWLVRADRALYTAKARGRDRVEVVR